MRAAGKSAHRSGAAADASGSLANQGLRLALFDHLPTKQTPKDPDSVEGDRILHPATLQLGAMFSKGVITSDDDRAHALVLAFYSIIQDYTTPPNRILREDLDKYIGKQVGDPPSLPRALLSQSSARRGSPLALTGRFCCTPGSILGGEPATHQGDGKHYQVP